MRILRLVAACLGLMTSLAYAESTTFKIAALAPPGTSWADSLEKLAKDIEAATSKRVSFKLYLGGVAGDEPDVLRKIRINQLHGGIFTGKALGDIFSDVRALEVPFNFHDDRQKAIAAMQALEPYLNNGLRKQGFENLGFFEIGKVYFVSKKEAKDINGLKGMKIWAWQDDPVVEAMLSTLNLVSVPLALPDVLNSLSTGIIDGAYASPLGIVALQWQSKIEYLIDFPITYGVSGFLIKDSAWKKVSASDQKIVQDIVKKYVVQINDTTSAENEKSLLSLKGLGVKFVKFPATEIARSEKIRADVLAKLKGKVLSEDVIRLLAKQAAH